MPSENLFKTLGIYRVYDEMNRKNLITFVRDTDEQAIAELNQIRKKLENPELMLFKKSPLGVKEDTLIEAVGEIAKMHVELDIY